MTKNIYLRKIILAAVVAVLALIYVIQLIAGSRSSVKDFKIETSFDTLTVSSADNGTIELKRYGDFWKIGTDDTENDKVKEMAAAVADIKTLSLVSKSSSEDSVERYGFSDAQKITVTVSDNGKELSKIEIGKDAASGQQNYIRFNGSGNIYLAAGALRSKFNKKSENLIKKPEPAPAANPAENTSQPSPAAL